MKMADLPDGIARTIAADGSAVYAVLDTHGLSGVGVIARAPVDGSSVTTIATGVTPTRIAVDAESLYYFRISPDSKSFELVRSDKGGGQTKVLLSDLHSPNDLVLADDLYVLELGGMNEAGRIQRISTKGDCGQVLATMQPIEPELFTYSHLAVNATDVFWITTEGISRATR